MKPASILILSLFLSTSSSFGQSNSTPSFGVSGMEGLGQNAIFNPDRSTPNLCPASLRANFLPDGDLIKTGPTHPNGIGQALHLTFSNFSRGQIAEATLLLRGWTPKGRHFQTGNESNPDAIRSQHIYLVPGPNQSATADIWIPGFSAVTSVEMVSATYKDGSSWARSGNLSCSVAPDGFMLVHP